MDADQIAELLEHLNEIQNNLVLLRHLAAMILGFLFGWLWFHDF